MSSLPKWLLAGGFLAGYSVLIVFDRLAAPAEPFQLEELWVSLVAYVLTVGSSLLVPWVLLPVIANEPHRPRRALITVLAGLLPAAAAIVAVACLFLGWDVPPASRGRICLSIAAWLIPAIGALAYTFVRGTSLPVGESRTPNPVGVIAVCVVAPLIVGLFSMPILAIGGWVTRTESPNAEQVAHAREFLLIDPALEIEPLAYYVKNGMDSMVRFKFIARTQDPTQIFDRSHVAPDTFAEDFEFPPGEVTHNEQWWDIASRPLSGGYVRVSDGRTLVVGYAGNDDGTSTVYAWRHEGAFEHSQAMSQQTDQ